MVSILPSLIEGELFIPPDFIVAKPTKQFHLACAAFLAWIYIMHVFKLSPGNYVATFICAGRIAPNDSAKSRGTITHPPCMTVKMTARP